MNYYDIIIIGGGIVGTSVARELSRYKLKIALLEKEEELSFGVSKSNSGIIHPGTQNPSNSLKGRLCVQGSKLTKKISYELGVDFKQVGELIVAFDKKDIARLNEIKKEAELLGVKRLKIVNRKWLSKHEPNLSKEAVAALYAPTAGIISPYRMVYALAENAVKNGVEVFTNTKVVKIDHDSGGFETHRFIIRTQYSTFKSKYVINAAGLFADEISAMVGIDDFKIMPRKGEEYLLDKKKEHITNHLLFPLPEKNSKGILVIKTSDGNPMIGPTAEDVEDKHDLSTSDEGLKKVLSSVQRMIPSIGQSDIIAYFAGLRPVARNDFIIRHEDACPGFINVDGIQSPGLTAAPAIALMVADILKQKGLILKKKLFFKKYRSKPVHLFSISLSKTKKLIRKNSGYGDIVCRCEMVSAKEIKDAIRDGASTLDGIKFRTRCQAGRCHGSFCTTRAMKILAEEKNVHLTSITKRGKGSELILKDRIND